MQESFAVVRLKSFERQGSWQLHKDCLRRVFAAKKFRDCFLLRLFALGPFYFEETLIRLFFHFIEKGQLEWDILISREVLVLEFVSLGVLVYFILHLSNVIAVLMLKD